VQLARLPDGNERRQTMTPDAAEVRQGMLALWVLVPPAKGRGLELVHVIAFDSAIDKGRDPEGGFAKAMADLVAINQRVPAFEQALAAFEVAVEPADVARARQKLQALLDEKVALLRPELDGLLQQKVGPFAQRARERLQ
jgi:hypothetical protein